LDFLKDTVVRSHISDNYETIQKEKLCRPLEQIIIKITREPSYKQKVRVIVAAVVVVLVEWPLSFC
jgi:hypothetical protein